MAVHDAATFWLSEVIHYDVPKPETKIIHKTKVIKKPVPVVHYVDYPVEKESRPIPTKPEHQLVASDRHQESKPKVVIETKHVMSEAYDCHDGMHHWKLWPNYEHVQAFIFWRVGLFGPSGAIRF